MDRYRIVTCPCLALLRRLCPRQSRPYNKCFQVHRRMEWSERAAHRPSTLSLRSTVARCQQFCKAGSRRVSFVLRKITRLPYCLVRKTIDFCQWTPRQRVTWIYISLPLHRSKELETALESLKGQATNIQLLEEEPVEGYFLPWELNVSRLLNATHSRRADQLKFLWK